MKKKTWSKKNIVTNVGPCKYCNVMISNTDSFVVFATKEPAHYQCMKLEDEKQQKDPSHNQDEYFKAPYINVEGYPSRNAVSVYPLN